MIGEASTAAHAIAQIPALSPDVAVLDVRLGDGDGITVCREVRSSMDTPPACLMLTSFSDEEALFTAIMAVPLGIAAALYLEEFADSTTRWNRFVEVNLQNLAAVPAIVYGLLAVAVMALIGFQESGIVLGGALAREVGEGALDLAPDAADGDAEHALAALE